MTGTGYIDTTKTNTETSSNTNAEIRFLVYANAGTKIYKNGGNEPYFSFKVDNGFVRVSLRENDYMSVTTTANKIEVENLNDFAIDAEWTRNEVVYGTRIKAKSKKSIMMMKLDKIYVLKVEIKTNETDVKPEAPKPNPDIKPEAPKPNPDVKPEAPKPNQDLNREISCLLFAAKGTTLYRSGWDDPIFSFSDDNSFAEIYFEPDGDDYISFLSDSSLSSPNATSKIDISVENINDFSINVEVKTRNGYHFTLIDPKSKTTITVMKSDKLCISRKSNPLYEISFLIYADKGTNFYIAGWNNYSFSFFGDNDSTKLYLKEIEYMSVWSKTNPASKVDISIENINNFDIDVKVKTGLSYHYTKIVAKTKTTITVMKSDKLYVGRTIHETKRIRPKEPAKFSLLMYGETGVDLFKNGISKSYFSFTKEGLSGVKVYLQDNDYIDIGPDKDLYFSLDKRMKTRRLIVRNTNNFCIIAIEENNAKTYIIASHSEAFIFFGKEARRLYMLKGPKELTSKPGPSKTNKSIIYLSFPIEITHNDITLRINGQPYSESTPISLDNLDELKLSIDGLTESTKMMLVVGSDPSNQNIMIKILDGSTASTVIRPGGVGVIEITLNSTGTSNLLQISNCLIQKINIYETSIFKFPFIKLPTMKMKSTVSMDVLNTTLHGLTDKMKAERLRKDPQHTNDCEVLAKMVYSTVFLDKEFSAAGPWVFAFLFSKEMRFNPVKVILLAVFKRWGVIGKYILKSVLTLELFNAIDKKVTELEPYKSKITYLMNREYSTFLFELDISDKGFIACMYRQVRVMDFTDFLGWLAEIPGKLIGSNANSES